MYLGGGGSIDLPEYYCFIEMQRYPNGAVREMLTDEVDAALAMPFSLTPIVLTWYMTRNFYPTAFNICTKLKNVHGKTLPNVNVISIL